MADPDLRRLIEQVPPPPSSGLTGRREVYFSGIGGPQYQAISEDSPATWTAAERAGLQRQMTQAGLLKPGSYANGIWDSTTQGAYKELLFMSSANNMGTQQLLYQLRNGAMAGVGVQTRYYARGRFVSPTRRPMDPKEAAAATRQFFEQLLDRDPDSAELSFLSDQFKAWAAEKESGDIEAARRNFEAEENERIRQARTEAGASGTPFKVVGGKADTGARGGTSVGDVSPEGRLSELIRERYASEIGRKQQAAVTQQASDIFSSGVGMLSSVIFGGNRSEAVA
jgi:hypothetical protein